MTLSLASAACGADDDFGATADAASGSDDTSVSAATSPTPVTDAPTEAITVDITVSNHPVSTLSVPYLIGVSEGAFDARGVSIGEISGSSGGGSTVRNVLSGDIPFGDVSTVAAIQAYMAGAPVVIIGGATQALPEVMYITSADSEMSSIEDVRGATIGFTSPGSVTEAVARLSLDAAGIDGDEVDMLATGGIGEGLTALEGGGVDVTAMVDPIYSADPSAYKILWRATDYIPSFQNSVIITSRQYLDENPDVAREFLAARADAIEQLEANPALAAELWGEELRIDPTVVEEVVNGLIEADVWGVGFSVPGLQQLEASMRLLGQVGEDEAIPWAEMIDQQFLPEGTELVDPATISI